MQPEYHDLVSAMRRNEVMRLWKQHGDRPEVLHLPLIMREANWALPVYDFSYLFDPSHSDYVGNRLFDSLYNEGVAVLQNSQFRLPYEEVVYLFKYTETAKRYQMINAVVLSDEGDAIVGHTYFKRPIKGDPIASRWTLAPGQFSLMADGSGIEISFFPDNDFSEHYLKDFTLNLCKHTKR
jgi:hypothetical protein